MKSWIGIDPGKGGAIAVVYETGRVYANTFENGIASAISEVWDQFIDCGEGAKAVIEKVHAFPGQGVSSSFTFGRAFGEALGALDALGIPYRMISPQAWQKGLELPKKKDGSAEHKRALKAEAVRRFPAIKVTLKTADALLIADWAMQNLRGDKQADHNTHESRVSKLCRAGECQPLPTN